MYYVIALIIPALAAAMMQGGIIAYRKKAISSKGAERGDKLKAIEDATRELQEIYKFADAYASLPQFESLQNQLKEAQEGIESQKKTLKEVEEALTNAQKNVEEKETRQQEYKTLKEEDERKLAEILEKYEQLSGESVALEQELGQSMKNLEEMMATLQLTDDQKAILTEFNDALLMAGSRLRDLITEYEVVRERLEGLQGQFKDLEEEYTRLVEQQLGT